MEIMKLVSVLSQRLKEMGSDYTDNLLNIMWFHLSTALYNTLFKQ